MRRSELSSYKAVRHSRLAGTTASGYQNVAAGQHVHGVQREVHAGQQAVAGTAGVGHYQ